MRRIRFCLLDRDTPHRRISCFVGYSMILPFVVSGHSASQPNFVGGIALKDSQGERPQDIPIARRRIFIWLIGGRCVIGGSEKAPCRQVAWYCTGNVIAALQMGMGNSVGDADSGRMSALALNARLKSA